MFVSKGDWFDNDRTAGKLAQRCWFVPRCRISYTEKIFSILRLPYAVAPACVFHCCNCYPRIFSPCSIFSLPPACDCGSATTQSIATERSTSYATAPSPCSATTFSDCRAIQRRWSAATACEGCSCWTVRTEKSPTPPFIASTPPPDASKMCGVSTGTASHWAQSPTTSCCWQCLAAWNTTTRTDACCVQLSLASRVHTLSKKLHCCKTVWPFCCSVNDFMPLFHLCGFITAENRRTGKYTAKTVKEPH